MHIARIILATIFLLLQAEISFAPECTTYIPPVAVEEYSETEQYSEMIGEITAYTDSPDEGGGLTATEEPLHDGVVANDYFPFGTIVEINGKRYIVKDRLGDCKSRPDRFDIWMPYKSLAYSWGRRYLMVKIISVPESGVNGLSLFQKQVM